MTKARATDRGIAVALDAAECTAAHTAARWRLQRMISPPPTGQRQTDFDLYSTVSAVLSRIQHGRGYTVSHANFATYLVAAGQAYADWLGQMQADPANKTTAVQASEMQRERRTIQGLIARLRHAKAIDFDLLQRLSADFGGN